MLQPNFLFRRNHAFGFLLLFFSVFVCADAAKAENPYDWFYGTWRVSYPDEAYGDYVNGSAIVSPSGIENGAPVVTIHLQDTRSKENYRIEVDEITQDENQIILKYYGKSPSAAKTYNGKADPAKIFNPDEETPPEGIEGVLVKSAAPDSVLDISTVSEAPRASTTLIITDDDGFPVSEEITLTLKKGSLQLLSGQWRYVDNETGMYARRAGRRIVSQGYVEGSEAWTKADQRMIKQTVELKDKRLTISDDDASGPYIRTHLKIEGDGLPVNISDVREIIFDSPHIRYEEIDPQYLGGFVSGTRGETIATGNDARRLDVLEIRVKVSPGIAAGPKTFRINGMDAVWVLQFEEELEQLAFKRKTGDGDTATFELAKILLQGDIFVLEAAISSELMFDKRLLSLKNGNREIYRTVVNQSKADFRTFTSEPMKVSQGGAVMVGNGQLPDVIPVQANPGETLSVYTADTKEPVEWGSIDVLEADALEKSKLIVHPPNQFLSDYSISTVIVDEPFGVYLRLPKKDLIQETEITFTNLRTQETEEIDVFYRGGDKDALVVYLAPESNLTVSSGLEDSFSNWMGMHLNLLETRDGDEVSVSFKDAETSFVVYDTKLKRRLGIRKQQIAATKAGLLFYYRNLENSAEFRANIKQQLDLIGHAELLIANDTLFDIHRIEILEGYQTLLQEGFEHFSRPASWPVHPTYGVPMSSSREQEIVGIAINVRAKQALREVAWGLYEDISIGLNRFVMEQTGVNGVYMAVWGRDVMGRRLNMMDRILGGLEAFGAIESGVLGAWRRKTFANIEANSTSGITTKRKAKEFPGYTRPSDERVRRFTEILKDLDIDDPARSARRLLEKSGDMPSDIAAIATAYDNGVPAAKLMEKLNMAPQELVELLDKYHTEHLGINNMQARRRMLRKYLGQDAPMPFDLLGTESKGGGTSITNRPGTRDDFKMPSWNGADEPYRPRIHDAELPHTGRKPMNSYLDDMLKELEAEDRMFGDVSEEYIAQRRARAFRGLEKQHEMVDIIEDITGARQRSDYGAVRFWQAKGCDPQQCAVGQVFMNHTDVSPKRVMSVLQMDDSQYRGVLENFLRDTQKVDNPALRQQIIDEYIAGG